MSLDKTPDRFRMINERLDKVETESQMLAVAGHGIVDRIERLEQNDAMSLFSAMTMAEILKEMKNVATNLADRVATLEAAK